MLQVSRGNIRYISGMNIPFHHFSSRLPQRKIGFQWHTHEQLECFVFISGDARFLIGEQCYPMAYGDIVLTAAGQSHAMFVQSDCFLDHYCFYLSRHDFSSLDPDAENPFVILESITGGTGIVLRPDTKQTAEMIACLQSMEEKLPQDGLTHSAEGFTELMRVLSIAMDASAKGMLSEETRTRFRLSKRNLTGYLDANFRGIRSLRDIAKATHFSEAYLSRLFKQQTGIGIMQYVRKKKLECAKQLLEAGSNVTDACYALGFENYAHFITAFRKEFGVTPGMCMARETKR